MIISFYNSVHIAVLLCTVAFCLIASLIVRRLPKKGADTVLIMLAVFNILLYFIKIMIISKYSWFDIYADLPLDLCGINLFICLLAITLKKEAIYNFLYFIGCPGAALALLLPNSPFLGCKLLEATTMIYYLQHMILAAFPIILILTGYFRPKISGVWKNAIIFVLSAVGMYGIDKLIFALTGTQANYYFLISSPGNPVLDILWRLNPHEFIYALPCLIVLIAVDMLMCLPFLTKKSGKNRASMIKKPVSISSNR